MKDETRGNKDKLKGVKNGMEIEQSRVRGGCWNCSGEGTKWDGVVRD